MRNNSYSDSDSKRMLDSYNELIDLKKAYNVAIHPANLPFRERWLEVFDNLYRSSEEGQTQALLFAQTHMSYSDHLFYMEFNHNNDYDETELEKEGITHLTMEEIYQLYLFKKHNGQPSFTLPPANLQPLFNHACRMGNLSIVKVYTQHNHNNRQPQLNIRMGLIIATLQNHYPVIDYLLLYLGDNFDDHIIQLIFLAYQQDNYYLAHKLLHRPIFHNTIQNAHDYLLRAINLNALFLVEIMLKHWYHDPEMKKHLHPYGHAIDLQCLYHQALIMNQKEILYYLEDQYSELQRTNEETLDIILSHSDNPTLLGPAIEKVTQKIRPASTLTQKIKVFCREAIFPATVCTLYFLYNQIMFPPSQFAYSQSVTNANANANASYI